MQCIRDGSEVHHDVGISVNAVSPHRIVVARLANGGAAPHREIPPSSSNGFSHATPPPPPQPNDATTTAHAPADIRPQQTEHAPPRAPCHHRRSLLLHHHHHHHRSPHHNHSKHRSARLGCLPPTPTSAAPLQSRLQLPHLVRGYQRGYGLPRQQGDRRDADNIRHGPADHVWARYDRVRGCGVAYRADTGRCGVQVGQEAVDRSDC